MMNEQILKQAIEKARKNGYKVLPLEKSMFIQNPRKCGKESSMNFWINGLLFSHDFAKAFWGEKPLEVGIEMGTVKGEIIKLKNWQYHLQQMVLEKEPLKYVKKFL